MVACSSTTLIVSWNKVPCQGKRAVLLSATWWIFSGSAMLVGGNECPFPLLLKRYFAHYRSVHSWTGRVSGWQSPVTAALFA